MNILISACLMGINCRYNGESEIVKELEVLKNKYNLIPVCPEIYGGLKTPRNPAERVNDKVLTNNGEDVTSNYTKGAEEILKLAKFYDCKYAILKERSPSCGFGRIYDGTFSKTIIDGNGVTADLLEKNGVKIIGESKIEALL
ncbi:MAG: DUF523 domain-containing protein [Clostridia bacterium]|nr:DUF523 domain-containing protein [Clostridia bacterium]